MPKKAGDRANWTEEQREREREGARKRRANRTEEEKQRRLERRRRLWANRSEEQKQQTAERARQWHANMTEEEKQQKAETERKARANMTEEQKEQFHRRTTLRGARHRAKKKGLPFELPLDHINEIWPPDNKCPVFGTPFVRGRVGPISTSPTFDQIEPDKGYTIGNVEVISNRANRIKSDATAAEVMMVAQYLLKKERERAST